MDGVGLIHMNGRMYDPMLGRFISADPIIQDPYTSQSFNRYTYVFNNPLAYTDPSGCISLKDALRTVVAIAITVYTGGSALGARWGFFGASVTAGQAITISAIGGFAAGAVQTGTLRGAVTGGLQAALSFGVAGGAGPLGEALKQGVVGGVMSELQGGNFGHGFAAAGFSTLASPIADRAGNFPARVAIKAAIGGTASRLAGGKFANGAVTAAFSAVVQRSAKEVADHLTKRAEDKTTSAYDGTGVAPDEANPQELAYVRSREVRSLFTQNKEIEHCALVCATDPALGPVQFALSAVHTDGSHIGCDTGGLSCPTGMNAVSDIHNHPRNDVYYANAADLRFDPTLELGQTIGISSRMARNFSLHDAVSARELGRNAWLVPVDSGRLKYFAHTTAGDVHREY